MFVSEVNDVKIFNLSAGKSLPEWISETKKRKSLNKNVDVTKRIELIKDFDMPGVSTSIRMSPDNQYILVTGTYKPRIKCYDVNHLSIKFERCFDSEVETFEVLSDDYSKLVFLQSDRYVEFHVAHGRHYRLRIPKVGRAMSYHKPSCDLMFVGSSPEIYRLNLERGQFLQSYESTASSFNACDINPEHHLFIAGSQEGWVEAWDPREKRKCGVLDVAMNTKNNQNNFPSVTSVKFKNGLHMAVGTATGHVLLYDIRSREPLLVKDLLNRIPVKKLDFNPSQNVVYSLDNAMLKIWDENTGKQMAYIESSSNFNDFCTIPNSGMFFFAQEDVKMQTFYIPALGPAPRWCAYLDNLTEELESETVQNIYDDYKFITKQELIDLGLDNLEGTNLLKGYMHGFFIDMRLYNKAKSLVNPISYEKYKSDKIQKKIEESRPQRLQVRSDVPKVNRDIALKFMDLEDTHKLKTSNLLKDDRFKEMFANPEFEVDKTTDEYRLLKPLITQLDKNKLKKLEKKYKEKGLEERAEREGSTDDDLFSEKSDSSDDDNNEWVKEVKKEHKLIRKEKKYKKTSEDEDEGPQKSLELHDMDEFKINQVARKVSNIPLGVRVAKEAEKPQVELVAGYGNRQMSFSTKKEASKFSIKRNEEMKKHREERKKVIRSIKSLKKR